MMLLVYTRRKLESTMGFSKINSFGDLGFAIYGPVGRFSVDAMIILSQASICFRRNWNGFAFGIEAKDKEKFGRVLGMGMTVISLPFGAFGALGYFAFGNETKDIITTNLGLGLVSTLVQLGLCINLFFTFPLMMNPVYEVVERRSVREDTNIRGVTDSSGS
ncbi:hypothetical protein K1719_001566 [Acacia pycnantha]|nr:hypothetical protein K1719_001566 [Acacia pycnantha]